MSICENVVFVVPASSEAGINYKATIKIMLTISASAPTNNFIIIVSSASSIPFNEDAFL